MDRLKINLITIFYLNGFFSFGGFFIIYYFLLKDTTVLFCFLMVTISCSGGKQNTAKKLK